MKKIVSTLLSVCLVFSLLSSALTASAVGSTSKETVEQTIKALGIIVGDENGNMNLGSCVTRAEFAKMMVAASIYKDTVGKDSISSTFKDVKAGYWASEYIRIAVSNGWFYGYSTGYFGPEDPITIEQSAAALLRLLGYTSSDIAGGSMSAYLSKFNALGLNTNLNKSELEKLTRSDCMTIFYNLMTTANKSGKVYAETLGYKINAAKELDFSSLVSANMKGPFVISAGSSLSSGLPFTSSNISVYKNGSLSELSSASSYDVYYYNANMRTVWIYNNRVTGTYTAASPSRVSPASVTVAGNSYTVETSNAAYKLSAMGPFAIGGTVTLLLGMNGSVVDVLSPETAGVPSLTSAYYGIVTSSAAASYTDSSGNVISQNNVKVACTDGVTRQFEGLATVGSLVKVTFSGTNPSISSLSDKGIGGLVSSDGSKLGSYSFSSNVQIMDTNSKGAYAIIYPARLADRTIGISKVRFYELDSAGKITVLILQDVTGDVNSYGVITGKSEVKTGQFICTYSYLIKGVAGSITRSQITDTDLGPCVFLYNGEGKIESFKNLSSTNISSLNSLYINSGSETYKLSENVQVYTKSGTTYSLVNLNTVSDLTKYSLEAYYDDMGYSAGGIIRVIIATPNS